MTNHLIYIWRLLVLTTLLVLLGIVVLPAVGAGFPLSQYLGMCGVFVLINLLAWFIMVRGGRKGDRDGTFILMAGLGVKFLLYLLYILLFWLVTKNLTKAFIITFFALYLIFTFFTAGSLLKLLKAK
jgi:hypothetical protein